MIVLFAGCEQPIHSSLNEPGAAFDERRYLRAGKYTIFHYYTDWCPSCKNWAPTMQAVNQRFPDTTVHFVNISAFDSPVARKYQISFVPNFRIYDPKGRLFAEGKAAEAWLRTVIQQRVGR